MSQNDTNFYQNNQRNQSIKLISKNNPQMIINTYSNEQTNRSLVNSNVPICNQPNELCCVLCGLGENNMLALGKLSKFKSTFQLNSNNFINLKNILLNSNSNDSNNTKIISHNYKV
ncbi:hypothetical protein BpHYR1_017929 [Brachionus plicatilis]|uniref:Uncharacterized protein n=1 Tax=Brachionus plicatilis TaxID=10195 RepID=A0A3M7SXL6_BRAPC|nr:hypothetical protein BpHYR1_017929 [Brachionus plicatilis]